MLKTRPFLKWAGNKYRCLDTILSTLPKANRLIEPFAGSGAILMNANYSNYLLADQNFDLINLYNYLRNEGDSFIHYCAQYFSGAYNNVEQFYQLRQCFNISQFSRLRAALFVYLNRHAYNGLCRYNSQKQFNVPFGRYKKPYFPEIEMRSFHYKGQQASFLHADFPQTFELAEPGDVIYCDPPYVALSTNTNFSYTGQRLSEKDQIKLAEFAVSNANRGIIVIISNHDTAFTRHHYKLSHIISFPVRRFISCKANQRKPVQELVAIFR